MIAAIKQEMITMSRIAQAALPLALITSSAFAAPAAAGVIEWGYTVTSVFTAASPTGPGAGFSFSPSEISWGNPAGSTAIGGGRSALTISDSPSVGSIFTNGAPGLANSYSHTNNVVGLAFPLLQTASLDITVALSALDPAGGDVDPFTLSFDINFIETDNDPDGGICADGSAVGEFGPGCVDIFVIALGDLSYEFEFDGESYIFSLFEPGGEFGALSDAACAAAGAGPGCIGFLTAEEVVNTATFAFIIEQIPEPEVLSLFGLGLVGLGLARRRRD
jgi:hypothetical protein